MKVNDTYEVRIIDNDINGNGIARINNFVLFIPFCLKGEEVLIKVVDIKKSYAFCDLVSIIKLSLDRCDSVCAFYESCGGCNFLHTNYDYENFIKKNNLERMFGYNIEYYSAEDDLFYRNKATFHVKDGKLCYYNASSHKPCFINECKIANEKINYFVNYLSGFNLTGIFEVMFRVISGKVMVNFICNESYDIKSIINEDFDCVYVNNEHFFGDEYLIDKVGRFKFSIYPNSFYQVNPEGMKVIYNIAKKYAGKGDKLLDLYCGTGTIGIWLSKNFNSAVGYEINESSIKNAIINKELNNINNIEFILGNASSVKGEYDVIVVDPPRSGLSKEVRKFLNSSSARRIVYISCNPFTLQRDLKCINNYNISSFSAFNMFPRSGHVECVVLLEIKKE